MTNNTETTEQSESTAVGQSALTPLLACPFCGFIAALRLSSSYEDDSDHAFASDEYHAVFCDASKSCGEGPGGCGATSGYMPTEAAAIDKWNSRAS